jgi:phosphoribosyl 1,2-cyclic phosphate phosphodiesterase
MFLIFTRACLERPYGDTRTPFSTRKAAQEGLNWVMRALILGSGGSQPTPKAGCTCRVCVRARREGGRNTRGGPSLWLPDHRVLVDTPEESNAQLNAANILEIQAVFWSHFHPDHTAGLRVVEYIARWGAPGVPTYLPQDLEESLEQISLFVFQRQMNHLNIRRAQDRVPFRMGDLNVTMLRHQSEIPMYSFVFQDESGRGLYNADHLKTLELERVDTPDLDGLDWAVVQIGLMPDGVQERILPPDHPARKVLMPLERICEIAAERGWKQLVFTHLYEAIRMHPEEYDALAERLSQHHGLRIAFAHDGMKLEPENTPEFEHQPVPLEAEPTESLLERLRLKRETIERKLSGDRPRMRQALRALMDSPEQQELERRSRG